MATDVSTLAIQVDSSAVTQAGSALDDLSDKAGRAEESTDDLTEGFNHVSEAVSTLTELLASLGVGFGFGELIKSIGDQQNAFLQLNAVIKSTGDASGVTSAYARQLADSFSQLSGVQATSILSAETLLLQFSSMSKTVLPEATQAVLDLSVRMGRDLPQAALQLARALQNPEQGIQQLSRRLGITLDPGEVKAIMDTYAVSVQEGQERLLSDVEKAVGGASLFFRAGLQGALQALATDVTQFGEAIGAGGLGKVLNDAVNSTLQWVESLQGAATTIGQLAGAGLSDLINLLGNIPVSANAVSAALAGIAGVAVIGSISALVSLLSTLSAALTANPYALIAGAVIALITYFDEWNDVLQLLHGNISAIQNDNFREFLEDAATAANKLQTALQPVADILTKLANPSFGAFWTWGTGYVPPGITPQPGDSSAAPAAGPSYTAGRSGSGLLAPDQTEINRTVELVTSAMSGNVLGTLLGTGASQGAANRFYDPTLRSGPSTYLQTPTEPGTAGPIGPDGKPLNGPTGGQPLNADQQSVLDKLNQQSTALQAQVAYQSQLTDLQRASNDILSEESIKVQEASDILKAQVDAKATPGSAFADQIAAGVKAVDQLKFAQDALQQGAKDTESIASPFEKEAQDLQKLDDVFRLGGISVDDYARKLAAISAEPLLKLNDALTAANAKLQEGAATASALATARSGGGYDPAVANQLADQANVQKLLEEQHITINGQIIPGLEAEAQAYTTIQQKIDAATVATKNQADAAAIIGKNLSPLQTYNQGVAQANYLAQQGQLSPADYAKQVASLADAFNGISSTAGDAENVIKQFGDTAVDSFSKAYESTQSWSQALKETGLDLGKLAVQLLLLDPAKNIISGIAANAQAALNPTGAPGRAGIANPPGPLTGGTATLSAADVAAAFARGPVGAALTGAGSGTGSNAGGAGYVPGLGSPVYVSNLPGASYSSLLGSDAAAIASAAPGNAPTGPGGLTAAEFQDFLTSVGFQESGNNPNAPTGAAGEIGQYQIKPSTGAEYGFSAAQLATPAGNTQAATTILTSLLNEFGNPLQAAEAYNGGPGHVLNNTVSSQAKAYGSSVVGRLDLTGGSTGSTPGTLGGGTEGGGLFGTGSSASPTSIVSGGVADALGFKSVATGIPVYVTNFPSGVGGSGGGAGGGGGFGVGAAAGVPGITSGAAATGVLPAAFAGNSTAGPSLWDTIQSQLESPQSGLFANSIGSLIGTSGLDANDYAAVQQDPALAGLTPDDFEGSGILGGLNGGSSGGGLLGSLGGEIGSGASSIGGFFKNLPETLQSFFTFGQTGAGSGGGWSGALNSVGLNFANPNSYSSGAGSSGGNLLGGLFDSSDTGSGSSGSFLSSIFGSLFSSSGDSGGSGSFLSGLGGWFSSIFGSLFSSSAEGNMFGSPAITSIAESGPEAVLPLSRGPDGKLGIKGWGAGASGGSPSSGQSIVIHNYTPANDSRVESKGPDGREMHITIGEQWALNLTKGGAATAAMRDIYGLTPQARPRG